MLCRPFLYHTCDEEKVLNASTTGSHFFNSHSRKLNDVLQRYPAPAFWEPLRYVEGTYLPYPSIAPWVGFIDECASFPNAAHDDQVDSMSQAVLRWRCRGGKRRY